jgi:hypothetical protein
MKVVHCKRDPFDEYVGRPSPYGNPFTVSLYGRGNALKLYQEWIWLPEQKQLRNRMRKELKGKTLACWCAKKGGINFHDSQICHAQTIAIIANETSLEDA